MEATALRVAAADVGAHLLAHAEDEPAAAGQGEQGEQDPERMRAEHPGAVSLAELLPEGTNRGDGGAQEAARAGQRLVVGQGDEVDAVGQAEVAGAVGGPGAAQQDQVIEVLADLGDEERKRPFAPELTPGLFVDLVVVDDEPHAYRRNDASAATGGPKRTQPARNPNPAATCMEAKTRGRLGASRGCSGTATSIVA